MRMPVVGILAPPDCFDLRLARFLYSASDVISLFIGYDMRVYAISSERRYATVSVNLFRLDNSVPRHRMTKQLPASPNLKARILGNSRKHNHTPIASEVSQKHNPKAVAPIDAFHPIEKRRQAASPNPDDS